MSISANKSRNIMEHIGFPQEAADTICDCTERRLLTFVSRKRKKISPGFQRPSR